MANKYYQEFSKKNRNFPELKFNRQKWEEVIE
jgi:hypothetical protein